MRSKRRSRPDRYRNQLIPQPVTDDGSPSVNWIMGVGLVLLLGSGVWAVNVWRTVGPSLQSLVFDWSVAEERRELLEDLAHFGHAILGPLELATLSTIILSFVHVIHQLRSQHHTEQTRFQPVVTCMALLGYDVEGTATTDRLRIANPSLKLRFRNLGDSPATFIGIDVKHLCLVSATGRREMLDETARMRSVQVDSLGRHDGSGMGEHETDLSLPAAALEDVARLIASICNAVGEPDEERLELGMTIRHENVMGLRYAAEGTFYWSRELSDRELSDREQFEHIEGMRKAWAAAGSEPAATKHHMTIGRYIRRGQTLQAALAQKSVARKAG